MFWRPASSPSAASPLPGRVACSDSSDNGLSPPTICGSIAAPVTGLLIGFPVCRAAASTVAGEGCGGTGMTMRLLTLAGGAAGVEGGPAVVTGTASFFVGRSGSAGCGVADIAAASATRMSATGVTKIAASETAASRIERRSAMIDHLEKLMLRIDPDRRELARLVAKPMQNVVDPLRSRIDHDIDRLRSIAADNAAVAPRTGEFPPRPIEPAVPRHCHHPLELARNDRRLRSHGRGRLHRADPGQFGRGLVHALLERDLGVRHARRIDIRRDRRHAAAAGEPASDETCGEKRRS